METEGSKPILRTCYAHQGGPEDCTLPLATFSLSKEVHLKVQKRCIHEGQLQDKFPVPSQLRH